MDGENLKLADTNKVFKDNVTDDRGMSVVYHVKWIDWSEQRTPIVIQNENGPCPLLAIFNILLLSRKAKLADAVEFIATSDIISQIADTIWGNMPENLPEHERLNYEQNISDAIAVFPNLQTGLDVNIKFSGVSSFEYTPELTIFDLLRIPLYHGWLVDPQDTSTSDVLGGMSYNQVVEKVISCASSNDQDQVRNGLIANEFLESTASQLTCHGIVSLREEMQPGSLAVLFRNNHFSTIHRHENELFTLVTDLGFLNERSAVWESLSSIQGESHFVDGSFKNSPMKCDVLLSPDMVRVQSQDRDYELALSLQNVDLETLPSQASSGSSLQASGMSDYELAKQLQWQEETRQTQSRAQPRPTVPQDRSLSNPPSRHDMGSRATSSVQRRNDSKCTIL